MTEPLVSCICATYRRPRLLDLAVRWYYAQDYPNKELIIVSDGGQPINIPSDKGIRTVVFPGRKMVGEKRNFAIGMAQGRYIAHMDDDDYFGPRRLSKQLAPILEGRAELTVMKGQELLFLPEGHFVRLNQELMGEDKVEYTDGTLVYDRHVWETYGGVEPIRVTENIGWIQRLQANGVRCEIVPNDGDFVYVRHPDCVMPYMKKAGPIMFHLVPKPQYFHPEIVDDYVRAVASLGQ